MKVLIVKNVLSEGPGTIAEHLRARRVPITTVDLGAGDEAPDPAPFSHVVILGGPMAVYEMHRYSYLGSEARLIERAIGENKHVLGVCLGAQMIAHVLGARVYPGPGREIGWSDVALTPEGMADPLTSVLAEPGTNSAPVFQWHGDTFDPPRKAVGLASSELFPNQAFRYRDCVYAFQFHIEVTPAIVHDWIASEKDVDAAAIDSDSARIFGAYRTRAENFYKGFFSER